MSDANPQELTINVNKSIMVFSGRVKINSQINPQINPHRRLATSTLSTASTWSSSLHGYLLGVLPSAFKPSHRRVFLTSSGRIDLSPEGDVVLMSEDPQLSLEVNLDGLRCSIDNGLRLDLVNGWRNFGHPYQHPCVTKHGTTIYLSGMMTGGLSNQSFTHLAKTARPNRKLQFYVGDATITIMPSGECVIMGNHQTRINLLGWYSLDGIYFETDNHLSLNFPRQLGGKGGKGGKGGENPLTSLGLVDQIQNLQMLDLKAQMPSDGWITEWLATIGQVGEIIFQVYRHIGDSQYQLVDEYPHTYVNLGRQLVRLTRPLKCRRGDYLGWRYPSGGTMIYQRSSAPAPAQVPADLGEVKWFVGAPPQHGRLLFTLGEPRQYDYKVKIASDV